MSLPLSTIRLVQNGSNDLVSTPQLLLPIGWRSYTCFVHCTVVKLPIYFIAISYISHPPMPLCLTVYLTENPPLIIIALLQPEQRVLGTFTMVVSNIFLFHSKYVHVIISIRTHILPTEKRLSFARGKMHSQLGYQRVRFVLGSKR